MSSYILFTDSLANAGASATVAKTAVVTPYPSGREPLAGRVVLRFRKPDYANIASLSLSAVDAEALGLALINAAKTAR